MIARSIARLAREDGLLDRLMREAVARPIRTWDEYAQDVMSAIGRTGITAPSPSPSARVHHVKLPEVPAFDLALHEDPTVRFISAEIGRTGNWEPLETELVRRLLPHYRRFIDLGANLGWYTVTAGLLLRGRGKVHAFEPALSTFRLLEPNVGMNGLDNVRLHQIAVRTLPAQVRYSRCRAGHFGRSTTIPPLRQRGQRLCYGILAFRHRGHRLDRARLS